MKLLTVNITYGLSIEGVTIVSKIQNDFGPSHRDLWSVWCEQSINKKH